MGFYFHLRCLKFPSSSFVALAVISRTICLTVTHTSCHQLFSLSHALSGYYYYQSLNLNFYVTKLHHIFSSNHDSFLMKKSDEPCSDNQQLIIVPFVWDAPQIFSSLVVIESIKFYGIHTTKNLACGSRKFRLEHNEQHIRRTKVMQHRCGKRRIDRGGERECICCRDWMHCIQIH